MPEKLLPADPSPETKTGRVQKAVVFFLAAVLFFSMFGFEFFPTYLHALGGHWVALMSGLASVCLTFWEKVHRDIGRYTLYLIAGGMVFLAGFQAWQDEHRNSQVLIAEKSSLASQAEFWKSQSYAKDADLRARDQLLAESLKALTQTQLTGNETQKSLTDLSSKILDLTRPVKPKIVTRGYVFKGIKNNSDPGDVAAALVATTTADYPSFKGYIECETPFDAYEIALTQGITTVDIGTEKKYQKKLDVNFGGSNWRPGDFAFVLLHGDNLKPSNCQFEQQ